MLQQINNIVNEIRNAEGYKEKQKIISKYILQHDFIDFISQCYSYDSFEKITKEQIESSSEFDLQFFDSIFQLTEIYKTEKYMSLNKFIGYIKSFISANILYQDLIYDFFQKDLKLGIPVKRINRITGGSVHMFLPPEIKEYSGQSLDQNWFIQRGIDGERIIVFIQNINSSVRIKTVNEAGKEITCLQKIKEELKKIYEKSLFNGKDIVLDGQIIQTKHDSSEDGSKIKSEFRKKHGHIFMPCFIISDLISKEVFYVSSGSIPYQMRYFALNRFMTSEKSECVKVVFSVKYTEERLRKIKLEYCASQTWNSIIFRKNTCFGNDGSIFIEEYFRHDRFTVVRINEEDKEVNIEVNGMIKTLKGGYGNPVGRIVPVKYNLEDNVFIYEDIN